MNRVQWLAKAFDDIQNAQDQIKAGRPNWALRAMEDAELHLEMAIEENGMARFTNGRIFGTESK